MICRGPVSKGDIAGSMGYKSIPGNLKRMMESLLKEGYITYTIPDKIRSKNQKYKLTDEGVKLFK